MRWRQDWLLLFLWPRLSVVDLLDKGSFHILVLLIERCFAIDARVVVRVNIIHVIGWFSWEVRWRVGVLSGSQAGIPQEELSVWVIRVGRCVHSVELVVLFQWRSSVIVVVVIATAVIAETSHKCIIMIMIYLFLNWQRMIEWIPLISKFKKQSQLIFLFISLDSLFSSNQTYFPISCLIIHNSFSKNNYLFLFGGGGERNRWIKQAFTLLLR